MQQATRFSTASTRAMMVASLSPNSSSPRDRSGASAFSGVVQPVPSATRSAARVVVVPLKSVPADSPDVVVGVDPAELPVVDVPVPPGWGTFDVDVVPPEQAAAVSANATNSAIREPFKSPLSALMRHLIFLVENPTMNPPT